MMQSLVTVEVRNTRIEAEIIKGKLESSGIPVFIAADDAGGMYPFPFANGFSGVLIQVRKEDFVRAKKLLQKKK